MSQTQAKKIAIVGAGWAGLSAAVCASQAGHQVTLFEASRHWGGRARSLQIHGHDGPALDNGQHILIGAYFQSLKMMKAVGIQAEDVLWRLPLQLIQADGTGLHLKPWPFPLNLLWGISTSKAWNLKDKWCLLRHALQWQLHKFRCEAHLSVTDICQGLTPTLLQDLIEPLCVAALNTPAHQASGQVFLRVLKDALFGPEGSADLLLPRHDLGRIFPHAAIQWLQNRGADCRLGTRIEHLSLIDNSTSTWQVDEMNFDHVVIATTSNEAARLIAPFNSAWAVQAQALPFEAIATVYIQAPSHVRLPHPMLTLTSHATAPAQFVFDRGLICHEDHTPGLMAFVVSAAKETKENIETQVLQQARDLMQSLKLTNSDWERLEVLQTVVEKRATFACTPQLQRPSARPFPHMSVCGDYIDGPYPATLEGAVMSGVQAILRA